MFGSSFSRCIVVAEVNFTGPFSSKNCFRFSVKSLSFSVYTSPVFGSDFMTASTTDSTCDCGKGDGGGGDGVVVAVAVAVAVTDVSAGHLTPMPTVRCGGGGGDDGDEIGGAEDCAVVCDVNEHPTVRRRKEEEKEGGGGEEGGTNLCNNVPLTRTRLVGDGGGDRGGGEGVRESRERFFVGGVDDDMCYYSGTREENAKIINSEIIHASAVYASIDKRRRKKLKKQETAEWHWRRVA